MKFKNLIFHIDDGIATLTFNRPNAMNALNSETFRELSQFIGYCEKDSTIKAVIITGAGDKAFIGGADIKQINEMQFVNDVMVFLELGHQTIRSLELVQKPVIAAVNGLALGGGLEIALGCDIRFASENAVFSTPEINLGVIPGWGGTQRLPRLVGVGLAKELIMSGEPIRAQRAYEIGLVNKIFPHEVLLSETRRYAKMLASKPSFALKMAKYAIHFGYDLAMDNATAFEIQCASQCFSTNDSKEGLAAFLEKRKPKFLGK